MQLKDEEVLKFVTLIKTLDVLSIAILLDMLTNRLAEIGRGQRTES